MSVTRRFLIITVLIASFTAAGLAEIQFTEHQYWANIAFDYVATADMDSDGDIDLLYDVQGGLYWSENDGNQPPEFTDHLVATVTSTSFVG